MAELSDLIRRTKRVAIEDFVTKRVLTDITTEIGKRIFEKGLDSNNARIGTYTKSYVKYGRKKENLGSSRKVILVLSGAMESDWKFLVLPDGNYGSGFTVSTTSGKGKSLTNYEKSFIVEHTYSKKIFSLGKKEDKQIQVNMEKELTRYLSKL